MNLTITCITIYYLFLTAILFKWTYHHQQIHRKTFSEGEELYADVTSLTSDSNLLKFSYYSLPYCKPQKGVTQQPVDFGQKLLGEQVFNSPYRFHINRNESLFLCTTSPLTQQDVEQFMKMSREKYQVNFILNNLPVLRFLELKTIPHKLQGIPIGFRAGEFTNYFFNHLMFRILLHRISEEAKFEIVGFQVIPFFSRTDSGLETYDSIKPDSCPVYLFCNPRIMVNETLTFSYKVDYTVVNMTWSSRWDMYVYGRGADFRWMSVIIVVVFYMLFRKAKLKSVVRVESEGQQILRKGLFGTEVSSIGGSSRWWCSKLVYAVLATGLQITCVAVLTVAFSALGLMSESSRGGFLTLMVVFYLFSSPVAGYAGVFLLRILSGSPDGWTAVAYQTGSLFPLVSVSVWTVANYVHYTNGSTAVASAAVYGLVFLLWALVSLPLALLGGLLASEHGGQGPDFSLDIVRSSEQTLRQEMSSWTAVFLIGYITFGMFGAQLDLILSSIMLGRIYSTSCALLVATLLTVIVSAEGPIVLITRHLSRKDRKWWQKLLLASFSPGLFSFVYSVKYFSVDGPVSLAVYLSYSVLASLAVGLSTGSVGFLSALYFVRTFAVQEP